MNHKFDKKGYLLEDFRLFHLRDIQREQVDYHYHEFYKILFLVSGTGGYSIEGKRYLLKAGDIVLVGKQCVHRPDFDNEMPYERMILYISPEFLEKQSTSDCNLVGCFDGKYGHVLRTGEKDQKYLFNLMKTLEKAMEDIRYGSSIMSNGILLQILVEINRGFYYDKSQKPEPIMPNNKRILEIVQYLDGHLTENIRIDDLSERFYLSRFHMMRSFKEETGTTIHNYLSERRLLLARDYINQGFSATDACFMCGFQSYASFSRAYGKLFGTTPTGRKNAIGPSEETFE